MFDVPPPPPGSPTLDLTRGGAMPIGASAAMVPAPSGEPPFVAALRNRGVLAALVCIGVGGVAGWFVCSNFKRRHGRKKGG